jgi:hypothetical protein
VSLPSPSGPSVVVGDDGSGEGRRGGGIGPMIGIIIRGGGVDGDNCEIHDRRGRGSRPVYRPNPGGIGIGTRGGYPVIGRGTFPINP